MKTWEISQYAPFQKRKMTFHGLTEDHTSMSVHFLHSGNVFSIPSLTKNNPYFEILYQKTVSRVKVAEEPEQNLTETHLFSTHASKASLHPSSAQDAHHKGLSRTQRGICLMALAGQKSFSATALNAAYGWDRPWSGHADNRVGTEPGCKSVKFPVTFS